METTPTEPQSAEEGPISFYAKDYRDIYFNHVQVGYTAFDLYAYLGNMRLSPEAKTELYHSARIIMAPLEAKLMHRYLGNALRQFEEAYGLIQVPESTVVE